MIAAEKVGDYSNTIVPRGKGLFHTKPGPSAHVTYVTQTCPSEKTQFPKNSNNIEGRVANGIN